MLVEPGARAPASRRATRIPLVILRLILDRTTLAALAAAGDRAIIQSGGETIRERTHSQTAAKKGLVEPLGLRGPGEKPFLAGLALRF